MARASSLTRGTERAHLSLPAASMRIKNLEEQVGVKLLLRTSQGVTLTAPGATLLAQASEIDFAQTLGYDFVGPPGESAIHAFLKRASSDLQRTIRWRIQVGSFEAACRMIEANIGIGVLPEGTARRHAQTMALKIVPLTNEWAVRQLQICVADGDALPLFARELVDLLVADGIEPLE
ncbi:LysR family transcriptional regulator [Paraburkholderia sacchari]|uniref:LysR family transcriptional regulator n=1 Tax=Paraburkholderia sacchari TaxID=159450 RepID=A0A8T6ZG89_9BURK|nr:LysR family transcriptional regulator [Paraburkholderia sacchari]NLP63846.1 LysR family transcriptional regulator [Paraburkholderia sacchari]